MRRFLYVLLIAVCSLTIGGCVTNQKSIDDYLSIIEKRVDENRDNVYDVIDSLDEALFKVGELITAAEKDEEPELPVKDPIVDLAETGARTAAPFLPFPFNVLIGLVPFGVAWFRAKGRADKRTAEESLLIAGLQALKKEDRHAFDKFVEYRDMAAKGLLTARKTAELLEGINMIRARMS